MFLQFFGKCFIRFWNLELCQHACQCQDQIISTCQHGKNMLTTALHFACILGSTPKICIFHAVLQMHLQIKFGCNWTSIFQKKEKKKGKKKYKFYIFYLTWPQMTLDLGTWPLTSLTYRRTPMASLTQGWFQSDFNFSKETQITKTNIST